MNMPDLSFSIIIVNFRSAGLLEKCLHSLTLPFSGIPHEIVVANNDPAESTHLRGMEARFAFRLVELPTNLGFGKASNAGARRARGRNLLFLNPDTEFLSGDFRSLEASLGESPLSLYGLSLRGRDGLPEPWAFGRAPHLFTLFRNKLERSKNITQGASGLLETEWVSGAALVISREAFSVLGGFDEEFFLYYEDADLCLRARQGGMRVFWYPFISFTHIRGQSHSSPAALKQSYFDGQRRYFRKHRTKIENTLLSFLQPLYRFFFS